VSTFLCVGDLHLGAGSDYGRVPGERLGEQEAVWAQICTLAAEVKADGMLFLGDAFEKRRPSPSEMLAFARPLSRLTRDVVGIPGNHDLPGLTGEAAVDVFGTIRPSKGVAVREPIVFPFHETIICALPWAPVSNLVAVAGGGDRDALNFEASQRLLDIARGLYAEARRNDRENWPIVLMTHFAIEGGVTPSGVEAHVFREPVIPLSALDAIGFDAVVAGHIHKPQRLDALEADDPRPHRPIFYVGSPMPLNFGEASCDHGVWLLSLEPGTEARAIFCPISSRRFVTVDVDLREYPEDGLAFVADEPGVDNAIVKVKIRATTEQARRLDVADLKRAMIARGAFNVWAVQIEVEQAERRKVAGLDESLGEEQALRLYLDESALEISSGRAEQIIDRTLTYLEEVRP
jgi:DNA repair exonuclease SbcCD nuclease subunit